MNPYTNLKIMSGILRRGLHQQRAGLLVLLLSLLWACTGETQTAHNHEADEYYYTCSMDPQVVESKPGNCPICKMELTRVKKTKGTAQGLQLSETQVRLAGIQTMQVRKDTFSEELALTGTLAVNQNRLTNYNARVDGRIQRLYVKNQGDYVRAGQVLYEIYSEELLALQREYLLTLEKQKRLSGSEVDYAGIADAARNKMRLLGLTEAQINRLARQGEVQQTVPVVSTVSGTVTEVLAREGDFVMTGNPVLSVADLSSVWVQAQVYATETVSVQNSMSANIKIPAFPGQSWTGRISFANPELNPDSKINLIRVEIANPKGQLLPGMQANVFLKTRQKTGIALPVGAVLRESRSSVVWVKDGKGNYRLRMVKTGLETADRVEIVSGLQEGETVVTAGAYLINSEYIFKKGADPMAGHVM